MIDEQNLPQTILVQILHDEEFAKKVLPFIYPEYFESTVDQYVFTEIKNFREQYHVLPTLTALRLQLEQASGLQQQQFDAIKMAYGALEQCTPVARALEDWLLNQTEKFCQERALHNGVVEAINIMNETPEKRHAIPEILQTALAVSFDRHVGHDYFEDAKARFDFYHRKDVKVPFDLEFFNIITNGGLTPKTLNVIQAGTNVGKSYAMCHMSKAWILMGYNVLYITLEMAEEKIAQRIDANLLDVELSQITSLPELMFFQKLDRIRQQQNLGRLIIKEYPTVGAHAGHFRHLVNELRLKKGFNPDVIVIDYLNICASTRFKVGSQTNSYTMVKGIAEELRGLAQELNVPILTATQFNRAGYASSDPGMEHTSESFGTNMTADLVVALITSEELEAGSLMQAKQLKNRYADVNKPKRFVMRTERNKMRLSNAPQEDHYIADAGVAGEPESEEEQVIRAKPTLNRRARERERDYSRLKTS